MDRTLRIFRAVFSNTTMVDTCHYILVKIHGMYTKSELECKLWALGEMTCQNRFPKCTTMAGDADRGEDGTCVGTEGI